MKRFLSLTALLMCFSVSAHPQIKTNDAIIQQIHSLRADKSLELSFDQNSNTSKIMAVSENFSNGDVKRAGVLAMNFAAGFHYAGNGLLREPDPILLTFWVLTKKPRFGENHDLILSAGGESISLGTARYVAKPRQDMEYLNFEITRENLARIVGHSNVTFRLGSYDFTFTPQQLKIFSDLLTVSEIAQYDLPTP